MRPIWVQAGDTFFTRSDSLLGWLIRKAEREGGEGSSWANHTGVVVESGWIAPEGWGQGILKHAVVIEALGRVRRGALRLNGVEVRVFRPLPEYTREELGRFIAAAEVAVGQRYGWWKLLGFLVKKYTGWDVPSLYLVRSRPICSYLAALVNDEARPWYAWAGGVPAFSTAWPGFGMYPRAADPDEMLDFAETHPQYWQEVQ